MRYFHKFRVVNLRRLRLLTVLKKIIIGVNAFFVTFKQKCLEAISYGNLHTKIMEIIIRMSVFRNL